MEELSEQIDSVVAHCEIPTFYGIGAGAGKEEGGGREIWTRRGCI